MSRATRIVRMLDEHGFRPALQPRGSCRSAGRAWMSVCPCCLHLAEPSLGIGEEPDDRVRLTCWGPARCEAASVLEAICRLVRRRVAA